MFNRIVLAYLHNQPYLCKSKYAPDSIANTCKIHEFVHTEVQIGLYQAHIEEQKKEGRLGAADDQKEMSTTILRHHFFRIQLFVFVSRHF